MKTFIILTALFSSSLIMAHDKVIYGQDNRYDVYEYNDPRVVELSRSTVALIKKSDLNLNLDYYRIPYVTYEESQVLCSYERFADQPTAAFCSGFLVAPNKIITAGHCIQTKADCEETRFVFNYRMVDKENYYSGFKNVYSCKRVLGQNMDKKGIDFAVIELDRDVTDKEPLKLADNENLQVSRSVLAIGHPAGLPTKITDNGRIRTVSYSNGTFVTNLDTFGGNSGSAVFNARTLEVEGILVRGETDYVKDGNSCKRENRIGEDTGSGETVTMISKIHERGIFGNNSRVSKDETIRYIWLNRDNTCNEFRGTTFIREVEDSYCPTDEDSNQINSY